MDYDITEFKNSYFIFRNTNDILQEYNYAAIKDTANQMYNVTIDTTIYPFPGGNPLPVGDHDISFKINGPEKYFTTTYNTTITIDPAPINITLRDYDNEVEYVHSSQSKTTNLIS